MIVDFINKFTKGKAPRVRPHPQTIFNTDKTIISYRPHHRGRDAHHPLSFSQRPILSSAPREKPPITRVRFGSFSLL